nr:MAG TPA: Baseplate component [Caudoviricetes sp.]
MRLYYPIEIDLYKPYPLPVMEAQQGNIGRGALVTLKANGAILQPTNEGVSFWAQKPDGKSSFLTATLNANNVQLDFTREMLAVAGNVQVEIRLTSGSGTEKTDISTPVFIVRVNPSNINDSAVESQNEFTALQEALASAQQALSEIAELKKTGLKGDQGEAATLKIGTVTASEPGSTPQVSNSGTKQEAVLDFVLPRGAQGPKGEDATINYKAGQSASVSIGSGGAANLAIAYEGFSDIPVIIATAEKLNGGTAGEAKVTILNSAKTGCQFRIKNDTETGGSYRIHWIAIEKKA